MSSAREVRALSAAADTWNDEAQQRRNRIVGAVHLAEQAMRVLNGSSATPLQRLEAGLALSAADCNLTSRVKHKDRLLTVAQSLHGLIHSLEQPAAVVGALPGLQPLQDTPAVRDILQRLVAHIYTLEDTLADDGSWQESVRNAWQASVDAIARTVRVLKCTEATPANQALIAHTVDLAVLHLQLCDSDTSVNGALVKLAADMYEAVIRIDGESEPLLRTLPPGQHGRLRCFRLYLALRYEQEVLTPLATSGGVFEEFMALSLPSFDVDSIAGLPYAEWGLKVIAASKSAVPCTGQAENAGDLLHAAGHYVRAAACLAQKAEHSMFGVQDTVANGARVTAVAESARLALMSAKACKKAHNAVLAGNPEACALYRKAVATLPAPSHGAQLFQSLEWTKDKVVVLEKVAGFYVQAADAILHNKRDESALWQEAAQIGETALAPADSEGPQLLLRTAMRADWKICLIRADAVARRAAGVTG